MAEPLPTASSSDASEREWPRRLSWRLSAIWSGAGGLGMMVLGFVATNGAITLSSLVGAALVVFSAIDGMASLLNPAVRLDDRGLSWSPSFLTSAEVHLGEVRSWRRDEGVLRFRVRTGRDRRFPLWLLSETHRRELIVALVQRLGPPESGGGSTTSPARRVRRGTLPPSGLQQWGRAVAGRRVDRAPPVAHAAVASPPSVDDDDDDERLPSPLARRVGADEVLEILVGLWRQRHGIEPDPDTEIPIDRATTIDAFARLTGCATGRPRWTEVGVALERIFRVSFDRDRWRALLDPPERCRVGPLCIAIARAARAPAIDAPPGSTPDEIQAAALRCMRRIMSDAGMNVSGLTGRSRLAPLLRDRHHTMVHAVGRINPGRMPPLHYAHGWWRTWIAVLVVTLLAVVINQFLYTAPWLGTTVRLLMFASIIFGGLAWFASGRYRLGELVTLGELAYALTSPPPPTGRLEDEVWDWPRHPQPHEVD